MAWIELHQTLWTHRKTVVLADALGLPEMYAAAHLARLWCWALDNAVADYGQRRGLLTGAPARAIAGGAGWTDDPCVFFDALIESGYLDRDGDDLVLHDWWDYAGKYLARRQTDADRKRQDRLKDRSPDVQGQLSATSVGCPTDVRRTSTDTPARTSAPTVPNLTVPPDESTTTRVVIPERESSAPARETPAAPAASPRYSPGFEAFWRDYPPAGRDDKAGAFREYSKHRPDAALHAGIMAGLGRWKASRRWQEGVIVAAKRWLRERRWEAEPEPATGPARASPAAANRPGQVDIAREGLARYQEIVGGRTGVSTGHGETGGGAVGQPAEQSGRHDRPVAYLPRGAG